MSEYKIRAMMCHPDKHLDNPGAGKHVVYLAVYIFPGFENTIIVVSDIHSGHCCFMTVADFQKLQEAKEVLCNEARRKNYDQWSRSGVTIPFHEWHALKDSVKTVCNIFSEVHF